MISFKFESFSFQINYNGNHKVINGQYWQLHMIVILSSEFLLLVITFSKSFYRYTPHVVVWMWSFDNRNHKNFNLLVPRQYRRYFAKFYAYRDSHHMAMLRAPWATSLRCHGALGVPPGTLRRVCYDATATCFRGDLTALVLNMFKTWRRPRRPWRPFCDLQRCHGALRYFTTTQRRSAAIWPILQIAARSPSCVTGVIITTHWCKMNIAH